MVAWKRTLVILWFANFCVTMGTSLIIPFIPLYLAQLGVHTEQSIDRWSSWVFSIQFVTSFIFQPIWGAFADRRGRKLMLLRAGFGMGAMTACMGLVTAPWQLLLLRFINGIFSGFISMAISLQASVTPAEQSGKALGTLQTGNIAGSLIGPLIGGVLSEWLGFQGCFFFTGALLVVASLIVLIFVHEPKVKREVRAKQRGSWRTLIGLWPVFLGSFMTQLAMMSIEPIVTIFTRHIYHGPHLSLVAGLVIATSGIANLIGTPTLGRIGDRIGQYRILLVAFLGAAMAFIPQSLAHNLALLLCGRFLLGLFIGGMLPSLQVLVRKLAPLEKQATAFGMNSSATFFGNLVGPLIGGSVAASYGIRSVFYVTMSLLVANAIVIAFNRKALSPRTEETAI
ncbi:DHA1 family multidrug resistance protein-like MFS transporter [Alicyclobacillus sacchari]|uniref:DHA1 family multidrug resistance protein-like MFS transporter n=2 Tax=Alicyclobacillus sacchari TaxID=392010 RepID=A0A4R8LNB6_9BACL|nr:MFS transporter [Alicyclobacillus sacchari]TDY45251.1 DHA1 family multidrug resistance protein-like MFS transporter [Alicyclobacillus sacchari]